MIITFVSRLKHITTYNVFKGSKKEKSVQLAENCYDKSWKAASTQNQFIKYVQNMLTTVKYVMSQAQRIEAETRPWIFLDAPAC